jgi:hypothetical protein
MEKRAIPSGLQDTCFQVLFCILFVHGYVKNIVLTGVRCEESWRGYQTVSKDLCERRSDSFERKGRWFHWMPFLAHQELKVCELEPGSRVKYATP